MSYHPNIVILGLKHTNSSIAAKMLVKLGWEQNDLDEHGESVSIRAENDLLIAGKVEAGSRLLIQKLLQPWVLKDPKFRFTLRKWTWAFMEEPPFLVYLSKDHRRVYNTHVRRARTEWSKIPIARETLEKWEYQCQRQYDAWPWTKIKIDVANLAQAVEMFDTQGAPSSEETLAKVIEER
jgi:hypothetical protein